MFPKAQGRITEALQRIPGVSDVVAREVALALCQNEDLVEHSGLWSITGNLDNRSRNYSPHTGADNLKPIPPMEPPSIDRGLFEIANVPNGLSDRRGENGYAYYVREGIWRNDGESWLLKYAQIDSTTTVTDTRRTELITSTGVTSTYWVADGHECADSKARDLSGTPIRVFYDNAAALPTAGSVVRYLRDLDGLAWGLPTAAQTDTYVQWGKATTGWGWEHANSVGYAVVQPCDDIDGANPAGSTTRVYIRANGGQDPNVQTDDVVGYLTDENSTNVAVHGAWDDKIGTVKMIDPAVTTIPGGWRLFTEMGSRVPFGYTAGNADYDPAGSTGGSHPIRPTAHTDGEPSSSTSAWKTDWAGTWYNTAWKLTPGGTISTTAISTQTSTTGITLATAILPSVEITLSITIGAATGNTGTRSLTVNNYTGNSAVTAMTVDNYTGSTGTTSVAVVSHSGSSGSQALSIAGGITAVSTNLTINGSVTVVSAAVAVTGSIAISDATITMSGTPTTDNATVGLTGNVTISQQGLRIYGVTGSTSTPEWTEVTVQAAEVNDEQPGMYVNGGGHSHNDGAYVENKGIEYTNTTVELTSAPHSHAFWLNHDHAVTTVEHRGTHAHNILTSYLHIEPQTIGSIWTGAPYFDMHGHAVSRGTLDLTGGTHYHVISGSLTLSTTIHSHTATPTLYATHGHDTTDTLVVSPDPHGHTINNTLSISPASHTHTIDHGHTLNPASHTHPNTHGHGLTPASHGHGITHDHTITPDPHDHSLGSHIHNGSGTTTATVDLDHNHTLTDPGHKHTISPNPHDHDWTGSGVTGYLYHKTEDFRPPWLSIKFIRRVGPGGAD